MFFLRTTPTREMIEGFAARHEAVEPGRVLRTLEALRWASVLMRRVETHLAKQGLSQTQFLAMMMVARETDRNSLTASEIAERLDVSRPVLSTAIKSLLSRGLLESAGSTGDRRAKPLRLTEVGRSRLDVVLPEYFALLQADDPPPRR